jgi:hypothetical protein
MHGYRDQLACQPGRPHAELRKGCVMYKELSDRTWQTKAQLVQM